MFGWLGGAQWTDQGPTPTPGLSSDPAAAPAPAPAAAPVFAPALPGMNTPGQERTADDGSGTIHARDLGDNGRMCSTPSTGGSNQSRHGFRDEVSQSPSPPAKGHTPGSASRHGFFFSSSDVLMGEAGVGESKSSSGTKGAATWSPQDPSLPLSLSSPSPAAKSQPLSVSSIPASPMRERRVSLVGQGGRRRGFELPLPPAAPAVATAAAPLASAATSSSSTPSAMVAELAELRELSHRLSSDTALRDARREKELEAEQARRARLFEASAATQRKLLERFKQEEQAEQTERQRAAVDMETLLSSARPFSVPEARALAAKASEGSVPVSSAMVAGLQQLVEAAKTLESRLLSLLEELGGVDDCDPATLAAADLEQLATLLQDPLSSRLEAGGGHPVFAAAAVLHRASSARAESVRKAKEETELPTLPALYAIERAVTEVSGATRTDKVLRLGFELASNVLLCSDGAFSTLSKKQRTQLWREALGTVARQAAVQADIATARQLALLLFATLYALRADGGDAACSRAAKVLTSEIAVLHPVLGATPVFLLQEDPSQQENEKGKEGARGLALSAVAALQGQLFALEPTAARAVSVAAAWTWLIRATKLLQRAVLKLGDVTGCQGADRSLLTRNVADLVTALLAFFCSAGAPALAMKYHEDIFTSVLPALLQSAQALVAAKTACSTVEAEELTQLQETLVAATTARTLNGSSDNKIRADPCELCAQCLALLAEQRRASALQTVASAELDASVPLLTEAVRSLTGAAAAGSLLPLDTCKKVSEACLALVSLLKGAGFTLSPPQRAQLLNENTGLLPQLAAALLSAQRSASSMPAADAAALAALSESASEVMLKGFTDAAETSKDRFAMCARQLMLLTEKRRLLCVHVLGRTDLSAAQEPQGGDSLPYKLNTIAGMLSKTTCVRLIGGVVDRILVEKPHLLLFALALIAKEIADKCSSEQFQYRIRVNPANIAGIVHGVVAATASEDFLVFVKAELQARCPYLVPARLDSGAGSGEVSSITGGQKGALCVYAMCCVDDRGFASPEDAWAWVAGIVNWCRAQAHTHTKSGGSGSGKPCLDMRVVDVLNTFLRVTAEQLQRIYGKAFERLLQTVLNSVLPLVARATDKEGRPVDDKLSEFLRGALHKGTFLSLFTA